MAVPEEEVSWKDLNIGAVLDQPGNTVAYETGDWKSQRPIVDRNKCNKCALCYIYCPEGCFEKDAEGYFEPDLFFCKGCGICAVECPKEAITIEGEE